MSLNSAIQMLYSIPEKKFLSRKTIDFGNIYADMAYSSYITYGHGTIQLRFPPECEAVLHLQNNHGDRMVYYERVSGFVQITADTVIPIQSDTHVIIYHTKRRQDVLVSFEMQLTKIRSHL